MVHAESQAEPHEEFRAHKKIDPIWIDLNLGIYCDTCWDNAEAITC
jgi:hypothetical protein